MSELGKSGVAAVERAIRLLEAVADADTPPTMQSLALTVGCSPSTAHRIVVTLTQGGLLQFDPATKRYSLGVALARLAQRQAAQQDLATVAQPTMDQLRDISGETVSLWARRNGAEVCLAVADGRHEIRQHVTVGATARLGLSAGSRILMADESRDKISTWVHQTLGDDPDGIAPGIVDDVTRIRATGITLLGGHNRDRLNPDVATVGSPVLGGHGEVVAALVIAGPVSRFTDERMNAVAADLRGGAATITRRSGGDSASLNA